MARNRTISATVLNGATGLSAAIFLGDQVPVRIQMSTGWSAADLTFQVSADGTTFFDKYDGPGGYEYTIKAAASRSIDLNPSDWLGASWIKVRSGTTGTPVNQGADRALTLVVREV
jgi:hypothetical protein